jgi:hypothetical protein
MGYYTHHSVTFTVDGQDFDLSDLDISEPESAPEAARPVLAAMEAVDENEFYRASTGESSKWYESDDAMKQVSALCPGAVFTMRGEGEEQGDVWERVYADGKQTKRRRAVVVMQDE